MIEGFWIALWFFLIILGFVAICFLVGGIVNWFSRMGAVEEECKRLSSQVNSLRNDVTQYRKDVRREAISGPRGDE